MSFTSFFCTMPTKMARQTLVIESPMELSLQGGMIVITDKETGEMTMRPLEDVGMVMIDNIATRVTIPLINKLTDNNTSVVFCNEKHLPVSMLMDLDSNYVQGMRYRSQIDASVPINKQIWKQIVEAKIKNQSLLLEKLGIGTGILAEYYKAVKSGDSSNREAIAAKNTGNYCLGKSSREIDMGCRLIIFLIMDILFFGQPWQDS